MTSKSASVAPAEMSPDTFPRQRVNAQGQIPPSASAAGDDVQPKSGAVYTIVILILTALIFSFSYAWHHFNGVFPLTLYKSQATTTLYVGHAFAAGVLLLLLLVQAVLGSQAVRTGRRAGLRTVHKWLGRVIAPVLFVVLVASVASAGYWNVVAPEPEQRSPVGVFSLVLLGAAAAVYLVLGANHARNGRTGPHVRDIAFVSTLLFGTAITRLAAILLRVAGWHPVSDPEILSLGLPNALTFDELQVALSPALVIVAWLLFARFADRSGDQCMKLLIIAAPTLVLPLAFLT